MRWFLRWQKVDFRRVINGALGPIGPANVAARRPAKAHPARGPQSCPWGGVGCTVAHLLAHGQQKVLRGLQRRGRYMANTPRRNGRSPNSGPRSGGRCALNWQSSRLGSWITVIWTRNGGIGSRSTNEIADCPDCPSTKVRLGHQITF